MPVPSLDLYVIKHAVIDHAASGDNTIVAAVAGKSIHVLSCTLISAGDMTIRFESGASGTALTGQMTVTSASGFKADHNPAGHFWTAKGELLNLELSAGTSADGWLNYIEV